MEIGKAHVSYHKRNSFEEIYIEIVNFKSEVRGVNFGIGWINMLNIKVVNFIKYISFILSITRSPEHLANW